MTRPADLAVLDLGVQDTPAGSARLALAARLGPSTDLGDSALFDGKDPLAMVWSHRGAPHLHRGADLVGLVRASWPWSDADAKARMGRAATRLAGAGIAAREGLSITAQAWRSALAGAGPDGLTKGEASAEVTRRLPDEVPEWCRGCQSTHVNELLFRLASLPGGARLVPGSSPLTFVPIADWPGVPAEPAGTDRLLRAYLRLLGPGTPTEAAGFLGTSGRSVASPWQDGLADDLVEVRVDGRPAWMEPDELDEVAAAPPAELVRLVAASDPYLQTRNRDLLVPDPAHRKALWKILGNPGAVLVDGEVAGIWRAKQTKQTKPNRQVEGRRAPGAADGPSGVLEVTVEPFGRLSAATRLALAGEADRVARIRGLEAAQLRTA